MDLDLTETQTLVQKTARDFATRVVAPRAAETDATERFPREAMKGLADLGLMAINVPPELGGSGAGVVAYALAMQEVARACASTAVMMSVTNMVGEAIARFGTDAQKQHHCPLLASGEHATGSFALSEPDAGSDPGGMRTTARRDGDEWVLDGAKQWITGGSYAGVYIVWARTAPPEAGARGISCFLVEGGAKGLKIGRPEDKMGIRGSDTVPLEFDGVRVPASALFGQENGGFKIAMMALAGSRHRAGGAGGERRLREGPAHVRRAHRAAPGHPVEAGRHADVDRRRAPAVDARGVAQGTRQAVLARGLDVEGLRERGRGARLQRGRADPRGLRLHPRARRRASLARRARHDDLRGHERDPARGDRAERAGLIAPAGLVPAPGDP